MNEFYNKVETVMLWSSKYLESQAKFLINSVFKTCIGYFSSNISAIALFNVLCICTSVWLFPHDVDDLQTVDHGKVFSLRYEGEFALNPHLIKEVDPTGCLMLEPHCITQIAQGILC